jgi:hypothetical protein
MSILAMKDADGGVEVGPGPQSIFATFDDGADSMVCLGIPRPPATRRAR